MRPVLREVDFAVRLRENGGEPVTREYQRAIFKAMGLS
jgi:hypothetical protein